MDTEMFYVYTLRYPDNIVFYVGKGKGTRINQHEKQAITLNEISFKSSKIKQLYLKGEKIIKTIEATFKEEQHALVFEAMLIEAYDINNLTNVSKGTKERKLKINDNAEIRLNTNYEHNILTLKHICKLLNITLKDLAVRSNVPIHSIRNNKIIKNEYQYQIFSVIETEYKRKGSKLFNGTFEEINFSWK